VEDVDYYGLWSKGIRYLIFDIDDTLIPRNQNTVTPNLITFIEKIKSIGFEIYLLSNSRHPKRVKYFSQMLGLPCSSLSFKPLPFGFWKALEKMQAPAKKTAMIGDQLFMDTLGGNWAGLYTIYITPQTPESNGFRIIMRDLEKYILSDKS
jgi:HAD superfamily phosphatase (TIGR01668 family)